jgi:hypothetical protein
MNDCNFLHKDNDLYSYAGNDRPEYTGKLQGTRKISGHDWNKEETTFTSWISSRKKSF